MVDRTAFDRIFSQVDMSLSEPVLLQMHALLL